MRLLDLVIIVVGPPIHREIIFRLIDLVQSRLLPLPPRIPPSSIPPLPTPYILHPIPRLSTPPPFEEFAQILREPFIITGGCLHWPAITDSAHSWSSLNYLQQLAGRGRVVPVESGINYSDKDWSQSIIPFSTLLSHLSTPPTTDSLLYLAQYDLFRQFPKLYNDIIIPDYIYSDTESIEKGYSPPETEEGRIMNAWFGPAGSTSPAHTDPYFNCYCTSLSSLFRSFVRKR